MVGGAPSHDPQIRTEGVKVIVAAILPKGTAQAGYAAHNTLRVTANNLIRAAVGVTIDGCSDFAANATMGLDAAANDTSLYGDGLHPVDAGHAILEPIAPVAINELLAA